MVRIVERYFDRDFHRYKSDEKEMESLMQGRSSTFCSISTYFHQESCPRSWLSQRSTACRDGCSGFSVESLSNNMPCDMLANGAGFNVRILHLGRG